MTTIVLNSIMLGAVNPASAEQANPWVVVLEKWFLIFYTVEMLLKMIAFGLFCPKTAYLRDGWNIMDFTIIVSGYLPFFFSKNSGINLKALRALRVLRPLRAVSTIKPLRKILSALFSALVLLKTSFIVTFFFFTVFSIAGL